MTNTLHSDDPLRVFPNGAIDRRSRRPAPLTQTRFKVTVREGVARVETWRGFRNAEDRSIEVTMTFPMPVRAVMYALEVETGGRRVEASAAAPEAAREVYEENGVCEGRLAVLHEEKLPGIHMVSVVHVPPGATVTVRSAWATFLTPEATGRSHLRIPMTVGDIYGRSPLIDSDDLETGGPLMMADLTVDAVDAEVRSGGAPRPLSGEIPLDRPLDISVPTLGPSRLSAKMRNGRRVSLSISPLTPKDIAIDAAVLIDRSGSMGSPCSSLRQSITKHAAVGAGLAEAAAGLTGADRIRLFDFNDTCRALGEVFGARDFVSALARIGHPSDGTEIGAALNMALSATDARDIVLITDGKSHALDIARLLQSGGRFTVVLIGDDSLEARVGHLAASSGGALIVARGVAVAEAVTVAFGTLRSAHLVETPIEGPLERLNARLDGLEISATWDDGETEEGPMSDPIRALAAALALPRLGEVRARELAVSEGLVGRYSSLVLVDENSQWQSGFPDTYKMLNAAPATFASMRVAPDTAEGASASSPMAAPPMAARAPAPAAGAPSLRRPGSLPNGLALDWLRHPDKRGPTTASPEPTDYSGPAWPQLDDATWNTHVNALAACALDRLPADLSARLMACAADGYVITHAKAAGLTPLALVIGLLAARQTSSRAAGRVARVLLRGRSEMTIRGLLDLFVGATTPKRKPHRSRFSGSTPKLPRSH